jgi:hypothetical protein|tara:strand:+ start:53 stop:316 length:264 start_codon:yes stop_codon:yes gene_type:complete
MLIGHRKKDLEYTLNPKQVIQKIVKTMLKSIGDKDDKMEFTSIQFFNMMTDEDFIAVHEAGQLTNLCLALSLDLQTQNYGKNKTYSA